MSTRRMDAGDLWPVTRILYSYSVYSLLYQGICLFLETCCLFRYCARGCAAHLPANIDIFITHLVRLGEGYAICRQTGFPLLLLLDTPPSSQPRPRPPAPTQPFSVVR